ncbi:MAG: hypothetical protein AB7S68_32765, partial [Polyangiaceae bacterium]
MDYRPARQQEGRINERFHPGTTTAGVKRLHANHFGDSNPLQNPRHQRSEDGAAPKIKASISF